MKNAAAVLAGGRGSRFGGETPKQFVEISGRMIIEYTVEAFEKNEQIDEICVVVNEAYIDMMKETVKRCGWKKVATVLSGGKERYDSSARAVNFFKDRAVNILIHDAARPGVNGKIIDDVILALDDYSAVCTAVSASDTIAVAENRGEFIEKIPPRNLMFHVQTPQGFRTEIIEKAYALAAEDPFFNATDDCGAVMKYLPDIPVKIVPGSAANIKVTRPEDISLVTDYIQRNIMKNE